MGFLKKVLGSSTPPPLIEVPGGLIPTNYKSRRSRKNYPQPETVFFKEISGFPERNEDELPRRLTGPVSRSRMGRAGATGQHSDNSRRRGQSYEGPQPMQFNFANAGSRHSAHGSNPPQPQFGMPSMPHGGSRWPEQQPLPSRGDVSRHDFATAAPNHPAPSQPQQHSSRQQHEQQQLSPHPAPRLGKIREGNPLPTGRIDPMATSSANLPLGHHGLREHISGMTHLDVERYGRADDPKANWKVLDDIQKLRQDGRRGKERKLGGGDRKSTGLGPR
jgi:hypothetical protein